MGEHYGSQTEKGLAAEKKMRRASCAYNREASDMREKKEVLVQEASELEARLATVRAKLEKIK